MYLSCTSTGRKCDGYRPLASTDTKKTSSLSPKVPLQGISALESLCHWSSTHLAQVFGPSKIWKLSLPQLASSEPAIKHALLALKLVEQSSYQKIDERSYLAALEPNQAIHHLIHRDKTKHEKNNII